MMTDQNIPRSFGKVKGTQVTIKLEARILQTMCRRFIRLARAGTGLAIVPDFLASNDVEVGAMKYVLPDRKLPTIDVFAVWPVNAPKHGLIHLALDAVCQR